MTVSTGYMRSKECSCCKITTSLLPETAVDSCGTVNTKTREPGYLKVVEKHKAQYFEEGRLGIEYTAPHQQFESRLAFLSSKRQLMGSSAGIPTALLRLS